MIFVVRILDLFSVSKHLGPYVNMIMIMVIFMFWWSLLIGWYFAVNSESHSFI